MGIKPAERLDTKVQVANLYYRHNMSQQEIANQMNLSRTTISRLLKDCIEEGIVSIHIKNLSSYQRELENKIKKKYDLKEVYVINAEKEDISKILGITVSDYLEQIINKNVSIGVSAGTTIEGMMYHMRPIDNYNVDVYQMLGDASHQNSCCASYLAITLAKVLHGTPHAMHVPLLVHTKVLRDLLMEEPFNKKHFHKLEELDVAIVGLGHVNAILPEISDTWYNFTEDKDELKKKGVVGDICGVFIDENGEVCETDIRDRTITLPLDSLRRIPDCIGVAHGRNKKSIARAALRGRYINVLMIDEELACALLENN